MDTLPKQIFKPLPPDRGSKFAKHAERARFEAILKSNHCYIYAKNNTRPRKYLNWKTPYEIFYQQMLP